jgi:hypothetical protein
VTLRADHDLQVMPARACERRQWQSAAKIDGKLMIGDGQPVR